MGRKTYESIGKPLPNRISLVLSREPISDTRNSFWNLTETAVLWVENRETAIFYADIITISKGQQEFFVIGGAQMYEIFKDLFNKIYITEVFTGDSPNGDAHFRFPFDQRRWRTLREESIPAGQYDDYPSKFSVLERKMKTVRYVELPDYYTETEVRQRWVARQMEFIKSPQTASPKNNFSYQYMLELEPA
jgi:dihydrofolate reductase